MQCSDEGLKISIELPEHDAQRLILLVESQVAECTSWASYWQEMAERLKASVEVSYRQPKVLSTGRRQ